MTPQSARPDFRRFFHLAAAVVMLALMLVGFWPYYTEGKAAGGGEISAPIRTLVVVHGAFMSAWVLVFAWQAAMIAIRRVRWHRSFGPVAVSIALGVTVTGYWMPVESVRLAPDFQFVGMAYRQFLCVMLAETTVFTVLVATGLLWRKRREAHRAMMLMATLSIMAGATVRMPVLIPLYGDAGWWGIFGPIFTLGALFVLVHSMLLRSFDRWMAGAFAFMALAYVAATFLATSAAWGRIAAPVVGA